MPSLQIGHMQFEKSLSLKRTKKSGFLWKNAAKRPLVTKIVRGILYKKQASFSLASASERLTDSFDSWLLKKDGFDSFAPVVA